MWIYVPVWRRFRPRLPGHLEHHRPRRPNLVLLASGQPRLLGVYLSRNGKEVFKWLGTMLTQGSDFEDELHVGISVR